MDDRIDRRTFLRGSSALLCAAAAGGPWLAVPRLARAEADGPLLELTARPANYEAVRSTFTTRITPVERFFLRSHFDPPPEAAVAAAWRLRVGGLVKKPLSLALGDLQKMKQHTVEAVLQCAGNGRGLLKPHVAGVQWRWGAMGNAEWTGVRLADLLARARVEPAAHHLALRGVDVPTVDKTPPFVRGIPVEKALHPDTLVALKMNGAPLSPLHGFPARLVVPGWVGDDWVKWLGTIDLLAAEPTGFFYETGYRFPVPPGPPGQPVPPDRMKVMTRQVVKSILGSISEGDVVPPGPGVLRGVAFSGEARVTRVDVTLDGGASWQPAKLDAHDSAYGFRVFSLDWKAEVGKRYRIASRATDSAGAVQPVEPVWNPSGYLYNAIEPIAVEVRA